MRYLLTKTLSAWKNCTEAEYSKCYDLYGGSFSNHPEVLDFFHRYHTLRPRYFSRQDNYGVPLGSFCVWSGFRLAGDPVSIKHFGLNQYPFNRDDIILPLAPTLKTILPIKTKILSSYNSSQIINSTFNINSNRKICIAKGFDKQGFSSSTIKNRNRELKRFIDSGGVIFDQSDFTPRELIQIYAFLFHKRWGKQICNESQSITMLENLRSFFFGKVLFIGHNPCAFQLITKAYSPEWINFDYVNGGYDLSYKSFSPGTIVTWLNIQSAHTLCESQGKKMRYSFGRPTEKYKQLWCTSEPLGRIISF